MKSLLVPHRFVIFPWCDPFFSSKMAPQAFPAMKSPLPNILTILIQRSIYSMLLAIKQALCIWKRSQHYTQGPIKGSQIYWFAAKVTHPSRMYNFRDLPKTLSHYDTSNPTRIAQNRHLDPVAAPRSRSTRCTFSQYIHPPTRSSAKSLRR